MVIIKMYQFLSRKLYNFFLFTGLLIGLSIQTGYTQAGLKILEERVISLETKLAESKARQEDAYNVQNQLEKHERELAKLAGSEKYRIQIAEIRANILVLRAKIEAILKEKKDLEENLRIAKIMLRDAESMTKSKINDSTSSIIKKPLTNNRTQIIHPSTETTEVNNSITYWYFKNIYIDNYFNIEENNEIIKNFQNNRRFNQDDLLKGAYQVYNKLGAVIHFEITKDGDDKILEIILNQRMDPNPNSYFTYIPTQTLAQFRDNYFRITFSK